MRKTRNLAASAGRWSAQHRKTAILGWIVFVVLAVQIGGATGTQQLTQQEAGVGDSGKASKIIQDNTPDEVGEIVLVSNRGMKATDPKFRAVVAGIVERLERTPGVREVGHPYGKDRGQISKDGHVAMVPFTVPGDYETASVKKIVDGSVVATKAADKAAGPGFIVEQFGDGSSEAALNKIFQDDLAKATSLSLPVTLLILLVAFGTLLAAGLPLLLAITAVMATMGLVGPVSQIAPVEESINHVILLIGLAVGVDYALFYLKRMREERAAGKSSEAALEAAAATSGRAVLISGVTVITAMAGMYLGGAPTFTSFASGAIMVVAVAMLGSLTVLPAVLSLLGDRIERTRIPGVRFLKRGVVRVGLWPRIVDRVMRRPALAAGAATAFLVLLALPAMGLQVGTPSIGDSLPDDRPIVQTFNRLTESFPAETSALSVVVKGENMASSRTQDGLAKLQRAVEAQPNLFPAGMPEAEVNPAGTVTRYDIESVGKAMDGKANHALDVLRGDIIPASIGQVAGVETYVGGETADNRDLTDTMRNHLPLVFAFVIIAAFMLLTVTFRSLVVPVKAIVLNLLSVLASYGALVLIFQHGWFKSLLGFSTTGPIAAWLPMFLFVVLFGLSMDYHVFILSRVKELVDGGMSTENAVSSSIKSTAGVITSAAIVMVAVFALFGSLQFVMFKQMGVGLGFAVLLDATLIRGVLLPASMKLLGERNWWLPKRLSWLPKVPLEGDVEPARA